MKYRLKNFLDDRGLLYSFYKKNFRFKRVFFISGFKNKVRGDHAHKTLTQVLINIDSKSEIKIGKKKMKTFKFNKPGEYIICNKKNWLKIHFKSKGTIAVLCDEKYDKDDYIYR